MSTTIGSHMLGSGKRTCGRGIVRNVASNTLRYFGHKAVDAAADAMKGNGVKITGQGRKRRVGRPRKAATHRKRR